MRRNAPPGGWIILAGAALVSAVLLPLSLTGVAEAQIVRDGSLGPPLGSVVEPFGPNYRIDSTLGEIRGSNLFHSFSEFNVQTLPSGVIESATFTNSLGVSIGNILSRVTGENMSTINGLLASEIPGANLFLLNPRGVIFGPNASLNVSGALYVSTADYVRMADETQFYTSLGQESVLSSAPVAAFGFLGPNPGLLGPYPAAISFQGSRLPVDPFNPALDPVTGEPIPIPIGQTMTVIGGNINIVADPETGIPSTLLAPSGQINLVSVASAGEVPLVNMGNTPASNVSSFSTLGRIELSGGSQLNVSTLTDLDGIPVSDLGNGIVRIRGGQFVMDNASITAYNFGVMEGASPAVDIDVRNDMSMLSGSLIETSNTDTVGGDISIKAKKLTLMDSLIDTFSFGTGSGGNISLSPADSLTLGTNSFVQTSAESEGNGGAINISVIDGSASLEGGVIQTGTFDVGRGGDITLNVGKNVSVTGGGSIATSGGIGIGIEGAAGNILVTAGESMEISGRNVVSRSQIISGEGVLGGSTGSIELKAKNFLLANDARIQSVSRLQEGSSVSIEADESVTVSGGSRILTRTQNEDGGIVDISAPSITFDQAAIRTRTAGAGDSGAVILSGTDITLNNSQITSASEIGSGRGGDVTLTATNRLSVTGQFTDEFGITSPSGVFANTSAAGAGGNIQLQATDVQLANGATISASSTSTASSAGNAGDIFINAGNTFLMENSSVTTQAANAGGGNITVNAGDMVQLINSQINTSVAGGTGGGGNITIDPNFVILQNSQILANAFAGPGGNITITTGVFLPDANSIVDASSQFGLSGTVTIQSPTSNLSAVWARLQQNYTEAAALLRARCAAQVSGQYSSFVQTGRDAIPLEPGGWLLSPIGLSADAGRGARGEGNVGSETEPVSLRGFDQNLSWPGLVQAPRRFVSILDSACGS